MFGREKVGMQSRDPEIPGSRTKCPTQSRPGLTSNPGNLTAFCFKLQLQLSQIQWVTLTFENGSVVQWSGATSFAILMAVRRNATTVGPFSEKGVWRAESSFFGTMRPFAKKKFHLFFEEIPIFDLCSWEKAFLVGAFTPKKSARLLQWVVFFSSL